MYYRTKKVNGPFSQSMQVTSYYPLKCLDIIGNYIMKHMYDYDCMLNWEKQSDCEYSY